jgi:hypothetical protein
MTREQQKQLAAALLKWRVERTSATMNGYLDEAEVRELLKQKRKAEHAALKKRHHADTAMNLHLQFLIAVVNELKTALEHLHSNQQIDAVLELLKPQLHERDDCRKHVEEVVDHMAAVGRAAEYDSVHPKDLRSLRKDLQRIRTRIAAFSRDNGIRLLGIPPTTIKRGGEQPPTPPTDPISRAIDWLDHWTPPSRWLKEKAAVARALQLLCRWKGYSHDRLPPVQDDSDWTKLAAMLYGDRHANSQQQAGRRIYGHVQNFVKKLKGVRQNLRLYRTLEVVPWGAARIIETPG